MKSKSIFASKTTWLGVAMMVTYMLEKLTDTNVLADYPIATAAVGLLIVILRTVTTRPVHVLPR